MIVCDRSFSNTSGHQFTATEYEKCSFDGCDFSSGDLSNMKFIDCIFLSCNLSLVKLLKTSFQDAVFRGCKMLGLRFDECSDFNLSFRFETCNLNHSSFYKKKIRKTHFEDCQLQEVDFTESDLTGSLLNKCDLLNATFENSILEKVDFRSAFNYSVDPHLNKIRKAKFSLSGLPGLLDKFDIEIA